MADIKMTVGDTRPALEATLINASGEAPNLLSAEVDFLLRDSYSGETVIESSCSIVDQENAKVRYDWKDEDTSQSGYFNAKFRVTFGAGTSDPEIQHFPNNSDIEIEIDDQ